MSDYDLLSPIQQFSCRVIADHARSSCAGNYETKGCSEISDRRTEDGKVIMPPKW